MALNLRCRIRRFTWSLQLLCSSLAGIVLLPLPAVALCEAELGPALEAIAAAPELQSTRLGILVETQSGLQVYGRDADHFFVPASNVKLLTTAAVLHQLGPNYRIRTSIYGDPQSQSQPLLVVGRGDPSLTHADLTRLATGVQSRGIGQVSRLLGDDSYFPGSGYNPNWEWEDVQAGYGAPVNSLILNGNALDLSVAPQAVGQPLLVSWAQPAIAPPWRIDNYSSTVSAGAATGIHLDRGWGQPALALYGQLAAGSSPRTFSIAVPQPADYFLQQLASVLRQAGVQVGLTAVVTPPPPGLSELASVESSPLSELLIPTNRDSDNLYAEALLKTLGMTSDPQALDATQAGLDAIAAALNDLGLPPASFELVDGSGIARQNLATPRALVSTLQIMATHPQAQVYLDSLAVAGVSGTLRNRLRGTSLAGNLRGKTGALTGNVSLTGYLKPPGYEPLVVSILINHSDRHANQLRQIIDQMLLQIVQLRRC